MIFGGTARRPDGRDRETRYPVVAFTMQGGLQPADLKPPSKPYLQHIAEGLRQSFPLWEDVDIATYLSSAPGADMLDPHVVLEAVTDHPAAKDSAAAKYPPPPLLAYQGGRGAEVSIWRSW